MTKHAVTDMCAPCYLSFNIEGDDGQRVVAPSLEVANEWIAGMKRNGRLGCVLDKSMGLRGQTTVDEQISCPHCGTACQRSSLSYRPVALDDQ